MANKWLLEDDCLAPEGSVKINYNGKNPFKLYKILKPTCQKIFQIGSSEYWERDFRWDTSEAPHGFYVRVYVSKTFDVRTTALFEMIFQGAQPVDPNADGQMTITVSAKLRTEYPMTTAFQKLPIYKGFLWFYDKIFYDDVRKSHLLLCEDIANKVFNEFRSILNMPKP